MQVSQNEQSKHLLFTFVSPLLSKNTSKAFLLTFILYKQSSFYIIQSGNGQCSAYGQCDCIEGWIGEACDVLKCKFDCHGRGECLPRTAVQGSLGNHEQQTNKEDEDDLPFQGKYPQARLPSIHMSAKVNQQFFIYFIGLTLFLFLY